MPRHPQAEILIAIAEGKVVEYRFQGNEESQIPSGWFSPLNALNMLSRGEADLQGFEWRVKPETKRFRAALWGEGATITVDSDEEAAHYSKSKYFVRWLTDWIEYDPTEGAKP